MERTVPHEQMFNRAKMFDKWATYCIYVSSLISIGLIFIPAGNGETIMLLNAFNCVIIAIVVVFDQIFNYLFFEAGKAKRLDFIDNSYGTDFSGAKSEGYFTNETVKTGIYKMAVNCFENSFFSSQISSKMIKWAWIKAIVVLIIFVFSAALGEKGVVNLLFQLSLPILLLQQAIKITFFYTRITTVYQSLLELFNDLKQGGFTNKKDPEIFKIVLEYQTTLTWAAIPLNDTIFKKNNAQLSKKWDALKENYNIQS